MPQCAQCSSAFEIRDVDREFYKKFDVSDPALCSDCRLQRRLVWRNERSLFKRNCDLTGTPCITSYHPEAPYTVYSKDAWWGDGWDGMDYGRDYDFGRPFFEQFAELLKAVPHLGIFISHGENSDYCPYSTNYKNCYLCVSGRKGEELYYCFMLNDARDCIDCYVCPKCERCYECINCVNVYNSIYSKDCKNSHDLAFCLNCESSNKCIASYGLRHKEYHIFNEPVSKEEYERVNAEIRQSSEALADMKRKAQEHFLKYPQKNLQMINVEHSTGDQLLNCSNAYNCYVSEDLQDCAHVWNTPKAKDCYDMNYSSGTELIYNSMSNVNSYASMCNAASWDVKNTYYSYQSFYSHNLFGCVGLKHKQNCILNKQYSDEDYKALKVRIVEQMKSTGEWGEFFPTPLSPFAYNETIANDYFPLSKEQVIANGWQWREKPKVMSNVSRVIPADRLPPNIKDIPDDILNWAIECEATGKRFQLVEAELAFYRKMGLPVPRKSPDQRYLNRRHQVNPTKIWGRTCNKCAKDMPSSFAPDRPERVYCETCYLAEIY